MSQSDYSRRTNQQNTRVNQEKDAQRKKHKYAQKKQVDNTRYQQDKKYDNQSENRRRYQDKRRYNQQSEKDYSQYDWEENEKNQKVKQSKDNGYKNNQRENRQNQNYRTNEQSKRYNYAQRKNQDDGKQNTNKQSSYYQQRKNNRNYGEKYQVKQRVQKRYQYQQRKEKYQKSNNDDQYSRRYQKQQNVKNQKIAQQQQKKAKKKIKYVLKEQVEKKQENKPIFLIEEKIQKHQQKEYNEFDSKLPKQKKNQKQTSKVINSQIPQQALDKLSNLQSKIPVKRVQDTSTNQPKQQPITASQTYLTNFQKQKIQVNNKSLNQGSSYYTITKQSSNDKFYYDKKEQKIETKIQITQGISTKKDDKLFKKVDKKEEKNVISTISNKPSEDVLFNNSSMSENKHSKKEVEISEANRNKNQTEEQQGKIKNEKVRIAQQQSRIKETFQQSQINQELNEDIMFIPIQKKYPDLSAHFKKLKRIFISQVKDAKELKIMASSQKPMIIFQYKYKKQSTKKTLKQVLRQYNNFKKERQIHQTFKAVFESVYERIPPKYYNIAVFGVQKSKNLGYIIPKNTLLGDDQEMMFYYKKKQSKINYTLISYSNPSLVEFDSQYILTQKQSHPDQYKLSVKFQESQLKKQQMGGANNILDNEEMESDQEINQIFQEENLQEILDKIYIIINKDTSQIQNEITNFQDLLAEEAQKDRFGVGFKKIQDNIQQLKEKKQNFQDIRNQIIGKITSSRFQKTKINCKRLLKKMLLAERQMESKLPILSKKKKIFQLLKKNRLLIIQGETGSGKSTQLPQILCQHFQLFDNIDSKPVLVTQPRRLATRSLAERVANEMGQSVGGFVDYLASANNKQISKTAKIVFKLDRLVLDEMTIDPKLSQYSCLVVDEAHERTISIDVILGRVKYLLEERKDFRVIVTSASMDIHLFEKYFNTLTLKVSGRAFPVKIVYREYSKLKAGDKFEMVHKISKLINQQILHDQNSIKSQYKGHILCFCSNVEEINQLVRIYSQKLNRFKFSIHALHGKITPQDQRKIFQDDGKYKFIFTSRIGQTAITIQGVKVVIDPGYDYEMVYDQKYKVSSMKLMEISQSSAKQRSGRAGRTGPGVCFRLYSEENFLKRRPNKVPQIENSSLQSVVLRLKSLRIVDVIAFPYLSRPDQQGLKRSLQFLQLIGAIDPKSKQVTKIGSLLVKLPIEPFLARAIIQAMIFQNVILTGSNQYYFSKFTNIDYAKITRIRLMETIIELLALVLNFSNLFFILEQDRQKAQQVKFDHFKDPDGDFFFLQNIYNQYKVLKANKNPNSLREWSRSRFINLRSMRQVDELVNEIKTTIKSFQFNAAIFKNQCNQVAKKLRKCKGYKDIVLSCLITSFCANLCKFSGNHQVGYTIVNQRRPVLIYGTSSLNLLESNSDWIVCYDLYTNNLGRLYCKFTHKVNYDFMVSHIDQYVWKKFDIESIQKQNPFYKQINLSLQTKILQRFRFDFNQCQIAQSDSYFLKDCNPIINEQINEINLYLKRQNNRQLQQLQKKLNDYKKRIYQQTESKFSYHYIANIHAYIQDGFKINSIEFSDKQYVFQITAKQSIVEELNEFLENHGSTSISAIKKQQGLFSKIVSIFMQSQMLLRVTTLDLQKRDYIFNYLQQQKRIIQDIQIKQYKKPLEARKKLPKTRIIMRFFAGTASRDNVFLSYQQQNKKYCEAEQMLDYLRKAFNHPNFPNQYQNLKQSRISLTNNRNGINILFSSMDQYEIKETLTQLQQMGIIPIAFRFPKFLKKYRDPDIRQSVKTDQQWSTQIQKLLKKVNSKDYEAAILVRGIQYKQNKNQRSNQRQRIQMTAEIISTDSELYQKMNQRYNGLKGIIGTQKVHIRVEFQQTIVFPNDKVFDSLKDSYHQKVEDLRIMHPMLFFDAIPKRMGNRRKIQIVARSPNQQDFQKVQQTFNEMFTPKLIKLTQGQFRILCDTQVGGDIIDEVEQHFEYSIYIGFERSLSCLKIYSTYRQFSKIQEMIKQQVSRVSNVKFTLSYRGKQIIKVRQVLEAGKTKYRMLTYDIIFKRKEVFIFSNLQTYTKLKNQIDVLTNIGKGKCKICSSLLRRPYRLYNCNCQFCFDCLSSYIRSNKNSTEVIQCPGQQCKKLLNINDIQSLLSQQEFNNICDTKVSLFARQKSKNYIVCDYCDYIFDKAKMGRIKQITCQSCGKVKCIECNASHEPMTCRQYQIGLIKQKKELVKLGVKNCPTCKRPIEKLKGCNTIKCTCGVHLCWKCLKIFRDQKQTTFHLQKYCGGLYDL